LARCDLCGRTTGSAVLETLVQISTLPDALGKHACECGHPEMRRLPDGVFHCPACGSEVIPPERLRAIKSGELSWKKRVFRKGGGRLATPA
jgi:ribosomal protein L37AE/L43A